MEILTLLIPLSVALVLAIAAAFVWSVRHGQFDDLEGPAWRILADDDAAKDPTEQVSAARGVTQPSPEPDARLTRP